jgi:hypothetical protein
MLYPITFYRKNLWDIVAIQWVFFISRMKYSGHITA